ncbi:MAG TPA: hypothetical protein VFA10_15355 [Ktedonobacteraceae bacterium]|nr:hypothetical protein [Ktedonobacteraceae bacterium]
MKLFDDRCRSDKSPQKRRKPYYEVINRSARADYEAVRQVLESWFHEYPEQNRALLLGKFRAAENYNHLSAFFELYTHALLRHQGFLVSPEYRVVHIVGNPIDFFVQPPDDLPFYLEAVVAMDSETEEKSERVVEELRQALSKMDDPNFLIDFKWERKSAKQLPTAQMRMDLQQWLTRLDPDEYATGEKKPEPASYDQNGWKILFFAIPRAKQGQLKHLILGQPFRAQWIPQENSLRKNLEEKAEKDRYGSIEYPYVIAVNILALDSLGCDLDEVFFGKEVYQFNRESGKGMTTRSPLLPHRPHSENGFWLARGRWRNEHVSAVLLVHGLWPLSIAHNTPTLWHNPLAEKPLHPDIWQGPQMILDPNTSRWNFREGKNVGEILCLPQAWPETNP